MLPLEAVVEYQSIHKKIFAEDITIKDAARQAEKFLSLYRAVYSSGSLRQKGGDKRARRSYASFTLTENINITEKGQSLSPR